LKTLGGYRGLSAEIRKRLEVSLEGDDPETRRLLSAIAKIAQDVTDAYGTSWRTDAFASHVFRGAVRELLDWAVISGEAVPRGPKPGSRISRLLEKDPGRGPGPELGFAVAAQEGFI